MSRVWVRRETPEPHPADVEAAVEALTGLMTAVEGGSVHGATLVDFARAIVADGWTKEAVK